MPCFKTEYGGAFILSATANSHMMSGQPVRALPLGRMYKDLSEQAEDKKNLAIGLGNLGWYQLPLGQLREAGQNFQRSIDLSLELGYKRGEAIWRCELGRLEAYQGRFDKSQSELESALSLLLAGNVYAG